ncbi:hypothetical protein LHYA1_G007334 [Lachnellula hyalina]|uniref:Small secreted protein n=1 Tax=Lachnellula hyalina TaxID=1316788 RepID=A0A8H8QX25_9HELO|nr:uncharacterized protein LHYA1_G007334 [Lachnellula hyalina]TVY24422.1 hypothetical protein LHYA1_G007334 [Lachnellula hyalina]
MHFSAPLAIFLSLTGALALPTKRAAATSAAVLTVQTYNDFSVSSGVSGNALAEVNAKFPIDQTNFAGVAASDLAIISSAAQLSEQAETATGGFNTAVAAASGTAATALQNGKIKNKVLKLQTDVMRIQIEVAQGNTASQSELAAQQAKLATNVALDKAAAGQAATAVSFAGSD